MEKIGIALSGGGHRASLFAIGVLLYLVDVGKNRELCSISSVSGGSLTNGYLAQWGKFSSCSPEEFEKEIRPLVRRLATKGTLWGWSWIRVYLLLTIMLGIATCAVWLGPWGLFLRLGLFVVGILATFELFLQRGRLCGRAFAATLFRPSGSATKLSDTANRNIDHIICATDLHAGEHVYFSGNFVCSYRFGWGKPGNLPLHVAVQTSAAFPCGFPARWLSAKQHDFQNGTQEDASWIVLSDGGVYDNMGEQWFSGIQTRKRRYKSLAVGIQEPQLLILVNSSANIPWSGLGKLRIPILGELLTMLRVILVLHDNTTTVRRRWLFDRFKRSASTGEGLRGAFVTIEQTPQSVARQICSPSERAVFPPEMVKRAEELLRFIKSRSAENWEAIAEANSRVATTLRSLGPRTGAALIRHAYVLAMCNLHVIFDFPLGELPTLDDIYKRLMPDLPH